MKKYVAVYRCLQCDAFISTGEAIEGTREQAEKAVSEMIHNTEILENPFLSKIPTQAIHNCSEDAVSVARFVGFRSISPEPETDDSDLPVTGGDH